MNQELEFAQTIDAIKELAKLQNNVLSEEQIAEAFLKIGMSKEELQPVYEYLKQKKTSVLQKKYLCSE